MKNIILSLIGWFFVVSVWAAPVNVNTATASEIAAALSGVGLVKAEAIVSYREAHGDFKSAQDLVKVKGIGEKTVANNLADILLVEPK